MSKSVLPMFSSKSFIVSSLIFRSLIHFEFIFVCGVRVCSTFIDLLAAVRLSQHHLLKRLFPIVYSCLLCQRLINHRCVGLSLGFLSCSIDLYFCFGASTILFWLLQLCSIVWSQGAYFLQLRSSFSRLLSPFGVFCVPIHMVNFLVLVLWKMPVVVW